MAKTFILFLLLFPAAVFAQVTITGSVLNRDDNRPLANVNVFLNNTTNGGRTAASGAFTLTNVKPGKYELTISSLGFSAYRASLTVSRANIILPSILLSLKAIELAEVKIKAPDALKQQEFLTQFKNEFIGTNDLAKQCTLTNPELLYLDFDEPAKTLTATSDDFLVIENNALGYRLKYLLTDFKLSNDEKTGKKFFYAGSVLFEELKGTPSQQEEWKQKREDVYANSTTHFLRAALNNKLGADGFTVLRYQLNPERPADSIIYSRIKLYTALKNNRDLRDSLSYWQKKARLPKLLLKQTFLSLRAEDMIENADTKGIYTFSCGNDALYVVYNKLHQYNATSLNHLMDLNNTSSTLVFFNAPKVFLDSRGVIANPGSLIYSGAWANKRVAELLPLNYEPAQAEPPVDSTQFKKADSALTVYSTTHPVEKAYLHLDKPYYAAGDTIYFKAYVTDGLNKPSDSSNILTAELISPTDSISKSIKLKLTDGTAAGDFALADTLKNGRYRLRAYTNTMRNAGEAYFFDEYITIANEPGKIGKQGKSLTVSNTKNQTKAAPASKTSSGKIDVQFFPEGGSLVNGVENKIAFKVSAPNGLGAEVRGTVTDEAGKPITNFSSQHLGMGIISLSPVAGKQYKAIVTFADSTKTVFDLPKAEDGSYVLSIDNSDPRSIKINLNTGSQNSGAKVNLIGQSGGVIYSYTACKLENGSFTTTIPKNIFPDGITQFTLFSANGEPMNERLVFIKNPVQLNLKLSTANVVYHPRQKVQVNVTATNGNINPANGNFSVAVTNESWVPVDGNNENTIFSNLLLTSDIKGYVEQPNYYFTSNSAKVNDDLDVLLLTQGYHRFEWKQVLNNKPVVAKFGPEDINSVSGVIKNTKGKPIPYGKVSLLSASKVFFSLDTVADVNGRFVFKDLPANDSMRYVIQAADPDVRKNSLIAFERSRPPVTGKNKNVPDAFIIQNDNVMAYVAFTNKFHRDQLNQGIVKHVGGIALKEVEIKEIKQKAGLKNSGNLNGAGNANQVITGDQLPIGCPVFTVCLANLLHRVHYVRGDFVMDGWATLVLLDGIQILSSRKPKAPKSAAMDVGLSPQADILNTLSVNDIASIEVITDVSLAAIYGVRGAGGVIIITTKRWGDGTSKMPEVEKKYAYYTPQGFYKARTFYSPRYDTEGANTALTDLRTTIYWNPYVITDKNGNAAFEYFNADTKGTYRVVVEGLDDNGHLARHVYRYKVE